MTNASIAKHVWTGPRDVLDVAETYLSEFVENAAVGLRPLADEAGLAPVDGSPEAKERDWLLELYIDDATDIDALDTQIAAFAEASGASWSTVTRRKEDLPDEDWVKYSLSGLGVVEVGRFRLYGAHDADKVMDEDGAIPIRIDANQAFGTGHHPTTFGCLTMLDRFAGAPAAAVLDLGCGSGVLAIAAAKLWSVRPFAVDIDPTSVAIARENAGLNGVASEIDIAVADGPADETVAANAPFDFVFANILAGPLVDFAPDMARIVKPFGRVLLAGLMAEQETAVKRAYESAGFRRINRLPPETPAKTISGPAQHPVWPILLFANA